MFKIEMKEPVKIEVKESRKVLKFNQSYLVVDAHHEILDLSNVVC